MGNHTSKGQSLICNKFGGVAFCCNKKRASFFGECVGCENFYECFRTMFAWCYSVNNIFGQYVLDRIFLGKNFFGTKLKWCFFISRRYCVRSSTLASSNNSFIVRFWLGLLKLVVRSYVLISNYQVMDQAISNFIKNIY